MGTKDIIIIMILFFAIIFLCNMIRLVNTLQKSIKTGIIAIHFNSTGYSYVMIGLLQIFCAVLNFSMNRSFDGTGCLLLGIELLLVSTRYIVFFTKEGIYFGSKHKVNDYRTEINEEKILFYRKYYSEPFFKCKNTPANSERFGSFFRM